LDNNGRSKDEQLNYTYAVALATMVNASTEDEFKEAFTLFQSISDYKDASILEGECLQKAEDIRIKTIYNDAINKLYKGKNTSTLITAIDLFNSILDYMDSSEQIIKCNAKFERLKVKEEKINKAKKLLKKVSIIATPIIIFSIALLITINYIFILPPKYEKAMNLYNNYQYGEAGVAFAKLGNYKESKEHLKNSLEYVRSSMPRPRIFASAFTTAFVNSNGTVTAIGWQSEGQCDVSDWVDIVAVSSNFHHTIGLKSDGTVVATGRNESGQCNVSDWKDIISISAGNNYTVGLKSNGTVVATGINESGQCNLSDWTNIISVSANFWYTIGLKADGTVVTVGYNEFKQCNVSGWRDIISVSSSSQHTVGLKSDGSVIAVGDNRHGQCNVSNWSDIIEISANGTRTIGLKSDGTVVATGYNPNGECDVSKWKGIISISSYGFHTVGLKSDGTVVAAGNNREGQCNLSDWTNIVNIKTGYNKTFGVKSDGTIVLAGNDRFIQDDLSVLADINIS